MKYIQPALKQQYFTCPQCQTLSEVKWQKFWFQDDINNRLSHKPAVQTEIEVSRCNICNKKIIWIDGEMVYPTFSAPEPNSSMPQSVLTLYNEAGEIYTKSPRAACALLRLAIDKLCNELGETKNNINDNIAALVKKGLPEKVQKALDIVRVIGNKSVHPGQIAIDIDNHETAIMLFKLINIIVDYMIAQPNEIDSLYSALPDSTRATIEKRDQNK